MANWLKRLFNRQENRSEVAGWEMDDSIFSFLAARIAADGKLQKGAADLPDEQRDEAEDKLRFAPGLMDAMFGTDRSYEAKRSAKELAGLVGSVAATGREDRAAEFYTRVTESESVINIMDDFLQRVLDKRLPVTPHLEKFARALAFRSAHRNTVKFGIALLGVCRDQAVIPDLKTLGMHDEFTVYSVVAIASLSDDTIRDLWDLAKRVDGWGRIQVVSRLAGTDGITDDIRDWLLREGYRNSIMYEYLAYPVAMHGRLHERLAESRIDRPLFRSAGEIINALIVGGPAEDISVYPHAAAAVENYVRHAHEHADDLSGLLTLHRITDFLEGLHDSVNGQEGNGWTSDGVANILIDIAGLLSGRDWTVQVTEALQSTDQETCWHAKQAAERLGLDIWSVVWERLQNHPLDGGAWYDATRYGGAGHADEVIAFALATLPLAELATGPKDVLGIGPEYVKYRPLEYVTTFLENYPGQAQQIVLAGLDSPVTRNRNMAINTLHKWGNGNWSEEIKNRLQRLFEIEPNKHTRENIGRMLRGGPPGDK